MTRTKTCGDLPWIFRPLRVLAAADLDQDSTDPALAADSLAPARGRRVSPSPAAGSLKSVSHVQYDPQRGGIADHARPVQPPQRAGRGAVARVNSGNVLIHPLQEPATQ